MYEFFLLTHFAPLLFDHFLTVNTKERKCCYEKIRRQTFICSLTLADMQRCRERLTYMHTYTFKHAYHMPPGRGWQCVYVVVVQHPPLVSALSRLRVVFPAVYDICFSQLPSTDCCHIPGTRY